MPNIKKDEFQSNVFIFEETVLEKENKELKIALAQLQSKEKLRDQKFVPIVDFTLKVGDKQ